MNTDVSIRGIRFGFLFVVALFALVGGFTLLSERHTNERIDELVRRAGERSHLIDRIRLDAMLLETAVGERINAQNDQDQGAADEKIQEIISDIEDARDSYTQDLPPGETEAWNRFSATSKALAEQVHTAVKYSSKKQAERARKHLEEAITPVTEDLDELADHLSAKDAEETQKTLHHREDLRARTLELAAGVSVLAILISLLVASRVVKLLGRQRRTIAEQVEELARRNRELDAFAGRVAHDLVSPLAPLKGYLTLIRRSKGVTDQSALEMLAQAESSASRMGELVEALLRFCRAGNVAKSDTAPTDLEATVTTLLLEVSQSAAANKVQLERHLEKGVKVSMPMQLLSSVAQNLLSNAVKYSAGREGAKVTVRVAADRSDAVLEVTDHGIGMSPESLRSLYQPFFRAPNAKGLPGHGLGLATTKRLVEAHGGTIAVKSTEGEGTQFTVRLPRAREQVAPPAAPPQAQLA